MTKLLKTLKIAPIITHYKSPQSPIGILKLINTQIIEVPQEGGHFAIDPPIDLDKHQCILIGCSDLYVYDRTRESKYSFGVQCQKPIIDKDGMASIKYVENYPAITFHLVNNIPENSCIIS